ncbi:hypothetical protein SISNIDRAFT_289470 [Sistotremastrum niveocremeum HHB9708]|uniref:Uncharacterized protein n=1 Tax=Sistotremastrum niveocremeum HHB9708 TaxID=1314777 RepID=A0A164YHT2_9AGAM|nr:hypothetical protein SISNIDRAFT_289470 [Sistotremastrum niveocremeum HHB9708]
MVVDTIQTCLQAVPALVHRAYQPHTYTSSSHIGQAPQPPDYPSPLQLPRPQHHPGYVIPKREEDSYVVSCPSLQNRLFFEANISDPSFRMKLLPMWPHRNNSCITITCSQSLLWLHCLLR